MRRGLSLFGICAILFTSAIAPTPADAFGGARGGGGFAFNPGGFQGFNPGGFQGFNPADARPAIPLLGPGVGAAIADARQILVARTGPISSWRATRSSPEPCRGSVLQQMTVAAGRASEQPGGRRCH